MHSPGRFFEWNMYRMIEGILIGRTATEQEQDIHIVSRIIAERLKFPQNTTDSIAGALRSVLWSMTRSSVYIGVGDEEKYRRWLYPDPEQQPGNLLYKSIQNRPPTI